MNGQLLRHRLAARRGIEVDRIGRVIESRPS
jgi:hypothetical protein